MVKLLLKYYKVPTEGVKHEERYTSVFVKDIDFGVGTLYVTESAVIWRRDSGDGFQLSYQDIPLLGISAADHKYDKSYVFVRAEPTSSDISDLLNSVKKHLVKIIFIPKSGIHLQLIFRAIKFCSRLNSNQELIYELLDVSDEE